MAELSTLARPYAKAAFAAALEASSLAGWSTALASLAHIITAEKVATMIASPVITAAEKASRIAQIAGDVADQGAANLLTILAENNRFALLPEISAQFELLKAEHAKSVEVLVTSAFDLSETEQAALGEKLTTRLSRQVNLTVEVDSTLIGGVIIKAGDFVIDDSVRGKLQSLADTMNS